MVRRFIKPAILVFTVLLAATALYRSINFEDSKRCVRDRGLNVHFPSKLHQEQQYGYSSHFQINESDTTRAEELFSRSFSTSQEIELSSMLSATGAPVDLLPTNKTITSPQIRYNTGNLELKNDLLHVPLKGEKEALVPVSIPVLNPSKQYVSVVDLKSDCGCTVIQPKFSRLLVPPGGYAQ